jgi:hypothetical protein
VARSAARRCRDRHRDALRSRADPRGRTLPLYACRPSPTMSISRSAISSAARTTSPTRRRRSRFSKRWARPFPQFAHFPLLIGAGGEALSKRLGSLSLRSLREDGIEPLALDCYLAKTGTSDPDRARPSLDALAAEFSFEKIGRAPAHFVPTNSPRSTRSCCTRCLTKPCASRLAATGRRRRRRVLGRGETQSHAAFRCADLWTLVAGPVAPVIEDAGFAAKAAEICRRSRGARRPGRPGPQPWGRHRRQGPRAVSSAAAGAHGPRAWTGTQKAATAHRARESTRAAQRGNGVIIFARFVGFRFAADAATLPFANLHRY